MFHGTHNNDTNALQTILLIQNALQTLYALHIHGYKIPLLKKKSTTYAT